MRARPLRQKQKGGAGSKVETPFSLSAAKADRLYDVSVADATLRPDTHIFATDETLISPPQPFVLKFLVMAEQKLAMPKTARGTSEIAPNTSAAETDHPKLKAGAHAASG
jgi:hypothetical protein